MRRFRRQGQQRRRRAGRRRTSHACRLANRNAAVVCRKGLRRIDAQKTAQFAEGRASTRRTDVRKHVPPVSIILDGLLGLGATPPLREPLRAACREMNRLRRDAHAFIFAVDVPTGLRQRFRQSGSRLCCCGFYRYDWFCEARVDRGQRDKLRWPHRSHSSRGIIVAAKNRNCPHGFGRRLALALTASPLRCLQKSVRPHRSCRRVERIYRRRHYVLVRRAPCRRRPGGSFCAGRTFTKSSRPRHRRKQW